MQEEDPRGPINEENLLEKGIENPKSLDSHELFELNNYINDNAHYEYYVKFINFSKPYDKLFAYGPNIINIKHPSGQDLLRFICYTIYKKLWENVSKESLGKLEDSIRVFLENSVQDYSQIVDFDYLTENEKNINYEQSEIWPSAKEAKIFYLAEIEDAIPEIDDFVPSTIICSDDDYEKLSNFDESKTKKFRYVL